MKTQPIYEIWLEKVLSKNSTKTQTWKLVPGPFVFAKTLAQPLLENEIFEGSYLY